MRRVIHSRHGKPIVHQWSIWLAVVLCKAAADELGWTEDGVEYAIFVGNKSLPGGTYTYTQEHGYINAHDESETVKILPGDELDLSW